MAPAQIINVKYKRQQQICEYIGTSHMVRGG